MDTPGTATFGMAVDYDRQVWAFGFNDGTASVVDLDTEEAERVLDDCDTDQGFGAGGGCLSFPYVRGDITGLQRRNALRPSGTWSTVLEGCPEGETVWGRVVLDADTPAGSSIVVSARSAGDAGSLAALSWALLGVSPADGSSFEIEPALRAAGMDPGAWLAVEAALQSADLATTPTLRRVDVQFSCEGVFE